MEHSTIPKIGRAKSFQEDSGFRDYINNYIMACKVCEFKRDKSKIKYKELPSVIIFEENPLDRVQCDLIHISDALKEDNSKYNYLLTVIDHHSKKAWAKLLRNKKAENIA